MNSINERKYKDALPLSTINRIRNILNDLGILTIETGWLNSAEGFYSVTITIQNTNLSTNGKGTTYEYALASAYGELMERLQNQAFFRLNNDLSQEALEYRHFYYAPDEKYMTKDEFLKNEDEWIKKKIDGINPDIDKAELLKKWRTVSYEKTPSDFIAIPYLNLFSNKLSYIPMKMVSKMYMSNGMCAGNTAEEALIQGISEVFERYVNKRILHDKIIPPSVPREYLKNYPRIDTMVTQLELSGNYEVIIKDCSLDTGLPVTGVILINKDEQNYFIKFGSHPIFEISVERTLTELLQGQDIKGMRGVREFSYRKDINDDHENFIRILISGCGWYPTELFSKKAGYEFKPFEDVTMLSNKGILKYLVNLLESKGYDLYIRNVSFLGFPSFHVIVPGLSEIEEIDNVLVLDEYAQYNRVKRIVRDLENITVQGIDETLSFLQNMNFSFEGVMQLLNLPVKKALPWYFSSIGLFITALYCKKGDYENAYKAFNSYLHRMQPNLFEKVMITYYKCVRDYLGARADNLEESNIIETLSVFYPVHVITGVIAEFGNPARIFTNYGSLKCWRCEDCQYKGCCPYPSVEKVYKSLKDRYAASNIKQEDTNQLLQLQ